jgi:hypothetical protein
MQAKVKKGDLAGYVLRRRKKNQARPKTTPPLINKPSTRLIQSDALRGFSPSAVSPAGVGVRVTEVVFRAVGRVPVMVIVIVPEISV